MLIDEKELGGEHGLERTEVKWLYQKKGGKKKWSISNMERKGARNMWEGEISAYPNANDRAPIPPAGNPRVWIEKRNLYRYEDVKTMEDVYRVELPATYVSEALKEEFPRWRPECDVMIKCQTGGGKNYFFENYVIPWCKENGLKCLYISNRVTLGRQEKNRLAKIFGMERQLELYTDEGLDIVKNFGCVTALSYQQLENYFNVEKSEYNQLLKREFAFVVIDEPHYFLDDAAFNPFTDFSFDIVTHQFRRAVKIYMSATPEQVFPLLKYFTPHNEKPVWNPSVNVYDWLLYEFDDDYDASLRPFAFRDLDDLVDIIKRSDGKWIVFVESIRKGERLLELLDEGALVTAASKESRESDGEEYRNVVVNEKFDSRVLITTKVLENGVNICDAKIKNMAIFSNDRTVFLQELGRVRRMSSIGTLNVYIHSPDPEQMLSMYKSSIAMQQALTVYDSSPTEFYRRYIANPNPIVNMRNALTILDNRNAHVNSLLGTKIGAYDIPFWQSIFQRIQQGDANALIREKFSWLGKDFSDDAWRGCLELITAQNDLRDYLEAWKEKIIAGDDKDKFKNGFSEKFKRVFGNRKTDKSENQVYGLDIMKKCLREHAELGFILESGKQGWVLRALRETGKDYGANESEVLCTDGE